MPVRADPPDPTPKRPKLLCPPGAWDCHFHLFGPAARYPFDPLSKYVSDDRLPEELFALHDRLGIARGLLVSGAGYGPDTRHLEAVLTRHGDRLVGVALLPEGVAAAEFRRLGARGVRAVRFVNPAHGGHVPPIDMGNARRAVEAGWHIQYYPFRDELAEGTGAVLDLPGQVVLDHFAHLPAAGGVDQPGFGNLLRLLDSDRVWVKLSGPMRLTAGAPPYAEVTPMARALIAHRPDRVLWASDWPHMNMNGRAMPNDADLLDLLLDWAPDPAVRDRILVDNPAVLFGAPAG
jgi:predicted TIM-barrel fold metal-dependent hydrolase